MSLLTKQQIADILWMSWDHGHFEWNGFKWDLIEWNEKQTAQIEIDWSKAPDFAVSAVAHSAWIDEDGYLLPGYEIASFERPAPDITPHPHAEMMAKYAEVAARRVDPWVEFEGSSDGESWEECICPISFPDCFKYRYIGDDK